MDYRASAARQARQRALVQAAADRSADEPILDAAMREILSLSRKCRKLMRAANARERDQQAAQAVEESGQRIEALAFRSALAGQE